MTTLKTKAIFVAGSLAALSIAALVSGCGGSSSSSTPTSAPATQAATTGTPGATATPSGLAADIGKSDSGNLTGAGATFPAPIYQAWFDDYNKKVSKNVQVNY
ncbi:MAG TPA: hypothetical protein VIK11_03180, partial [Tepidiformaceae bacterium]